MSVALSIEKHHKGIIASLAAIILFFLFSCTFHDIIPICHYLFGCDHMVHAVAAM
jgi:hypothetical protein